MVRFLLSSLLITGLLFATNVRAEQRCPPEILKGRAFSGEVISLDAPIADYVFKRGLTLRRGRSIRNINEDFQYPYYGDLDIEISPTDDLQNLAQTLRPDSEESQKQVVQLLESLRSQSGDETIYVSMDTFLPPIFQPNFNSSMARARCSSCVSTALHFYGIKRNEDELLLDETIQSLLETHFELLPRGSEIQFGDLMIIRHPENRRYLQSAVYLDGGYVLYKTKDHPLWTPTYETIRFATDIYRRELRRPVIEFYRPYIAFSEPPHPVDEKTVLIKNIALALERLGNMRGNPVYGRDFYTSAGKLRYLNRWVRNELMHGQFQAFRFELYLDPLWALNSKPFVVAVTDGEGKPVAQRNMALEEVGPFLWNLIDAESVEDFLASQF